MMGALGKKIYGTRQWSAIRRAVFNRDGWRCTSCRKPGRLECHHVTPLEREPNQDPFDINGLATLCRACHIEETARQNRRKPTAAETLWQNFINELLEGNPL